MFGVCHNCAEFSDKKKLSSDGKHLVCPLCNYEQEFLRLPLFIITGASGSGKSTVWREILYDKNKPDVVMLESDLLWRKGFAESEKQDYRDLWLDVCCHISQSGRPVALFGSATPSEFENSFNRQYFTTIHYLVLTCAREELKRRLQNRPDWRFSNREEITKIHLDWNQWFLNNAKTADPLYTILDTTEKNYKETARQVTEWIEKLK